MTCNILALVWHCGAAEDSRSGHGERLARSKDAAAQVELHISYVQLNTMMQSTVDSGIRASLIFHERPGKLHQPVLD